MHACTKNNVIESYGVIQSNVALYDYPCYTAGQLVNLSVHFTLHTDPRAEVPEFTINCRTYGGPATTFNWTLNNSIQLNSNISQAILDTSENSVYDHTLRVRGRKIGCYQCFIWNVRGSSLDNDECISCKLLQLHMHRIIDCELQLQESPLVWRQSSQSPTVVMSM